MRDWSLGHSELKLFVDTVNDVDISGGNGDDAAAAYVLRNFNFKIDSVKSRPISRKCANSHNSITCLQL